MLVSNDAYAWRKAVCAQQKGLFDIKELVMSKWSRCVTHLIKRCKNFTKLKSISLPPTDDSYSLRATRLLSWKLGHRVLVTARGRRIEVPWQISAATLLRKFLALQPGPSAVPNINMAAEEEDDALGESTNNGSDSEEDSD